MAFYEVLNTTSGNSFGAFEADSSDEAIQTVMRLGGGDDTEPGDDIEAREVYGFKTSSVKSTVINDLIERMGEATEAEAEAMYDQGEHQIEGDPLVIWWVRDWNKAMQAAVEEVAHG